MTVTLRLGTSVDPAAAVVPTPPATPTQPVPLHEWIGRSACSGLDLKDFHVEAGHVIREETLDVCRGCPVRRECVIHFYLGGPDGGPIQGGYGGGFSLGQRKAMTLEEALDRAAHDTVRPIAGPVQG